MLLVLYCESLSLSLSIFLCFYGQLPTIEEDVEEVTDEVLEDEVDNVVEVKDVKVVSSVEEG
jgi:hypothetical protein